MRIIHGILTALLLSTGIAHAQEAVMDGQGLEKATFAGGCFWCMQPFLDHTKGVRSTVVGYTGGHTANPTYEEVSSGDTGHAEAIEITFDPKEVAYAHLLEVFFQNIDPTAVNSQFADHGTQYRTAVFYHGEAQKAAAEKAKADLAASGRFDGPIATEIVEATTFYPAEEYHQKFYQKSSMHYKIYSEGSGRHQYLDKVWGKK